LSYTILKHRLGRISKIEHARYATDLAFNGVNNGQRNEQNRRKG
jgi:hypothetical protein